MKRHDTNILIAGATGYLGVHIVRELMRMDWPFRAIARNPQKLATESLTASAIEERQVTDPESLAGVCDGIDVVISTVGITRQKDGLTYMDVDYQANRNLLDEALRAGVRKFIYVSVLHGDKMRHLRILEAKERFVDDLKASGLDYTIVRPNGFFSDMGDFLEMAKRGRVFLFGDGSRRLNPIHGADLAQVCIDAIDGSETEIEVGGPDILTHEEIAELALRACGKKPKVTHLPDWVRRFVIALARRFTSVKVYGPLEFFLTTMGSDFIAPTRGTNHLRDFFLWLTHSKAKLS